MRVTSHAVDTEGWLVSHVMSVGQGVSPSRGTVNSTSHVSVFPSSIRLPVMDTLEVVVPIDCVDMEEIILLPDFHCNFDPVCSRYLPPYELIHTRLNDSPCTTDATVVPST